jgi:hypothetical protein
MKRREGFTVIEIIVAILVVVVGIVIFFSSQAEVQATTRDTSRKTSINAAYYALENSFYKQHNYYPQSIDSKTLPVIDPGLFKDPAGIAIDQPHSTLHYKAIDCDTAGECHSYELRATLEREADFVKNSIHS